VTPVVVLLEVTGVYFLNGTFCYPRAIQCHMKRSKTDIQAIWFTCVYIQKDLLILQPLNSTFIYIYNFNGLLRVAAYKLD